MSTVREVADRVFREHLYPLDDQPVVITFGAEASRTATSWTYAADTLSPEELDLLAPGIVVEADDGELALVTDVDTDASTITVRRGHAGTTATKHDSGTTITVAPVYGRRLVLEAVKDEVEGLYPDLHCVSSYELTTDIDAIEVPAEVLTPGRLLIVSGTSHYWVRYTFMADYPPSSTGKAIFLENPADGYTAYLNYEGKFQRPTYDTDELYSYGVQPGWERIVAAGAAMKAVAGRDTDQLSAEHLTEQLEREALGSDVPRHVRDGLRQLRLVWLDQARRAQVAERQQPVVHNPVGAH